MRRKLLLNTNVDVVMYILVFLTGSFSGLGIIAMIASLFFDFSALIGVSMVLISSVVGYMLVFLVRHKINANYSINITVGHFLVIVAATMYIMSLMCYSIAVFSSDKILFFLGVVGTLLSAIQNYLCGIIKSHGFNLLVFISFPESGNQRVMEDFNKNIVLPSQGFRVSLMREFKGAIKILAVLGFISLTMRLVSLFF